MAPDSHPTNGRSSGVGRFEEGRVKAHGWRYHLSASDSDGRRYMCIVDNVYHRKGQRFDGRVLDVSGKEFRLGENELDLRAATGDETSE